MTPSHELHMHCWFEAIRESNLKAIRVLFDLYDLDPNDNSMYEFYYATPMHLAAQTDNEATIRLIYELGGKIDGKDYYEETPLYQSMKAGLDVSSEVLLKLGASLYIEVPYFNRETQKHFMKTPLYHNKQLNDGKPSNFVVPYTNEYKRLKKLQCYAKVVDKLMKQYYMSVDNVWKVGGVGYEIVNGEFHSLVLSC